MSAPEGWYPDPAGNPGLERYWDGSSWSSETRPIGAPEPPPAPEPVMAEDAASFGGAVGLDQPTVAGGGLPPAPGFDQVADQVSDGLPSAPSFDDVAEGLPSTPSFDQVADQVSDGLPPAPSFDDVADGLPPAPSFDDVADGLPPAPSFDDVAEGLPSTPDFDQVADQVSDGLPPAPSFDDVAEGLPPAPSFDDVAEGLPPAPAFDQVADQGLPPAPPAPSALPPAPGMESGLPQAPGMDPGLPPAPGMEPVADPGLPPAPGMDVPGSAPVADPSLPPAPGMDAAMTPVADPGLPPAPSADQAMPPAPAAVDAAPAAPAPSAPGSMPGFGGIRTELLSDERYAEVGSGERVVRQNSRLIKVVLGDDILARQGSMVAFQGQIDFDYEGSGAGKFLKKAVTGEGLPLMRCSGQGELFLADSAYQIHIIYLDGAGLTVNGKNVLAFEPTLSWDIERIKGAGMMAGGLFNTRLEGHGWVAITTDGDPVVLRTDQPTFADTDAAVAWSSSLSTSLNKTVKAGALIGRGSGEAVQLAFQGQGIVIVQPSEGSTVPPHSH